MSTAVCPARIPSSRKTPGRITSRWYSLPPSPTNWSYQSATSPQSVRGPAPCRSTALRGRGLSFDAIVARSLWRRAASAHDADRDGPDLRLGAGDDQARVVAAGGDVELRFEQGRELAAEVAALAQDAAEV